MWREISIIMAVEMTYKKNLSIEDIEDTSLSGIYEYKCILFSLDHAAYFAVSHVIQ